MSYSNVVPGGLKLKGSRALQSVSLGRKRKRDKCEENGLNKKNKIEEIEIDEHGGKDNLSPVVSNSVESEEEPETKKLSHSHVDDSTTLLLEDVTGPRERLTPAEKAFRLAQRKREQKKTDKRLELTHRQRMEKFNAHLKTLPEHFDIPKVGPG